MSSELMMDSGISGKTKVMILGGVVVAFALTIGILMRPGKPGVAKPKPVAAQTAQPTSIAAATPDAMPATLNAQLSSNETTSQAAAPAPADAMIAEPARPASDTAAQVAINAPTPAPSASAATEAQDTSDWNEASFDDSSLDAPDQQVAAQTPASQPRTAVRPPPPPAIDALQQWWRNPAKRPAKKRWCSASRRTLPMRRKRRSTSA